MHKCYAQGYDKYRAVKDKPKWGVIVYLTLLSVAESCHSNQHLHHSSRRSTCPVGSLLAFGLNNAQTAVFRV